MVDRAHCAIFLQVVLYTLSSLSHHALSREQRANLKFLAKPGKTPSESFAMLQKVYGEETMSRTCAFEWRKRFKDGREEVEDDPRSGRPSTSRMADNIGCVKQMVRADRPLTVRMIVEELSINKDTVWSIITENLEMRKVCAKMVPKLLSEDQKQQRVTVCQDIIEHLEDDSLGTIFAHTLRISRFSVMMLQTVSLLMERSSATIRTVNRRSASTICYTRSMLSAILLIKGLPDRGSSSSSSRPSLNLLYHSNARVRDIVSSP